MFAVSSLRAFPENGVYKCSQWPSGLLASFSRLLCFSCYGLCPVLLLLLRRALHARYSSYPPLWPFLGMYQIWALWIDKSPEHGGRTSPWFRSIKFWTYFADYYPASCVLYRSTRYHEINLELCADFSRRVVESMVSGGCS
jgi:hypothetical protein